MLAIALEVIPDHDQTALALSALAGTLTVLVMFSLGVRYGDQQGFGLGGIPAFPFYVSLWEGWPSLVAIFACSFIQSTCWRSEQRALTLALIGPWSAFSLYWSNPMRYFLILCAVLPILEAQLAVRLAGTRLKSFRFVGTSAAVMCLLAFSLLRSAGCIPRPAPYQAAAERLKLHGARQHISSNPNVAEAYLGRFSSWPVPAGSMEFNQYVSGGIRYLALDPQINYGGYQFEAARRRMAGALIKYQRPLADFPYPADAARHFHLERSVPFAEARRMSTAQESTSSALWIYGLSFKPKSRP